MSILRKLVSLGIFGAGLLTVSTASADMFICLSSPVPPGWVVIQEGIACPSWIHCLNGACKLIQWVQTPTSVTSAECSENPVVLVPETSSGLSSP